ncbi:CHAP domain-containing protein [Streptococcus salivarius]|uniref:CHAP domain-containing protein n=1 Tax=Streptococcus salivarius TaxID=1304 RepID=UPI003D272047
MREFWNFSLGGIIMKRITANQFQTSERYYKLPKVLFEDYAKKYGHENFTMRNWADFQYYKDKTLDLVIAVTTAKFTLFNIQSVIDLTQKDSMDLQTWGTQKTMVYLVIPDNDTTFRFLSALFFSMVFSTLTRQADVDFKGQLPIHVRSYLDEFANVGEIPDFAEQTSTVSSWNMSLVPILQNIAQLFLIYWEGNSGDKLLERQTRASEWYYQIEKGFSQPNGGTAQSDLKALEAVRGDLFENSIPGGGDGMGYAYGQCTWGVAARINQLGLKLKGKNGEKIPIISTMGNGQDWVRTAASLGGETGTSPQAGDIISFAGGGHGTPAEYGHVAFVEKLYPNGSFLISETNYNGNPNYTFRKLSGVDSNLNFAYTTK